VASRWRMGHIVGEQEDRARRFGLLGVSGAHPEQERHIPVAR